MASGVFCGVEHTNFIRGLSVRIHQLTSSFLPPKYTGVSITLQTETSLPKTWKPIKQACERWQKTWFLPSTHLLSSWRNIKCPHQSPTGKSVERTEKECQRKQSLTVSGAVRKVSHSKVSSRRIWGDKLQVSNKTWRPPSLNL